MQLPFRIGIGFDIHSTKQGNEIVLGGIKIPAPFSLQGHSDADILIHAIIDALLGSLALGDIGGHFPDTDPEFKGIDSQIMLKKTLNITSKAGYIPAQMDSIIIAERPRLAPFLKKIQANLGKLLGIKSSYVGVKAKTYEKIGALGNELALEARCVLIMVQKSR
ncbi:2-C-methyl-D-erythritol 2,4-cyclodiphosphate synthase [Candidatus Riflebacteria bacterium]